MRRQPGPFSSLLAVVLAACGATKQWQLTDPGRPSTEQLAQLREAERHYRAGEDFAALRQQLVADPVTAWWHSRMVVRDVVSVREGRVTGTERRDAPVRELPNFLAEGRRSQPGDDDALLRAAAKQRDPVEVRALAEMDALGIAAGPCLVHDLARHPQTQIRRIGVELLARIGEPVLPLIDRELLASAEAVERRTGAQVLGAMAAVPGRGTRLRALLADADYGVRAAACDGLATGDADDAALLRRAVESDADPFVRRTAARALAGHRGAESAQVLIAYLQRCKNERDAEGASVAQEALQRLAGTRGERSIDAWRQWASGLVPTGR